MHLALQLILPLLCFTLTTLVGLACFSAANPSPICLSRARFQSLRVSVSGQLVAVRQMRQKLFFQDKLNGDISSLSALHLFFSLFLSFTHLHLLLLFYRFSSRGHFSSGSYCSLISCNNTSNLFHSLSWRGKVGRKLHRRRDGGFWRISLPPLPSFTLLLRISPFLWIQLLSFCPSSSYLHPPPEGVRVMSVSLWLSDICPQGCNRGVTQFSVQLCGIDLTFGGHTHTNYTNTCLC